MKFEANREAFLDAINSVKDVAGSSLDILNNIKIETVGMNKAKVTATNLDITVTSIVDCDVKEEGATTVRAKMISAMVGAMAVGTTVSFSYDNGCNRASIVGGDVRFNLATLPINEFPKATYFEGLEMTFKETELKGLLKKTGYAASDDTTRRSLQAVCFQGKKGVLNVVATDGRRLALCTKKDDSIGDFEMILPSATVKVISRMLGGNGDVTITVKESSSARFMTDKWMVQTKLVDDVYPNWRQVVPTYEMEHAYVDKERFSYALRQASITSSADTARVNLTVKSGILVLKSMNDDETATSDIMIPIKYEGEGADIILSSKYVADLLSAIDENDVSFNFTEGGRPITITAEGADAFGCIMPMRV
jgi:DNA polymerase III subunit beta